MADHLGRPCPRWCTVYHSGQEGWKGDQFHVSAPVELDLTDSVGVRIAIDMYQYPLATRHTRRQVYASLVTEHGGDELTAPDVLTLADGLVVYAEQLRRFAADLVQAQAEDHAARSDRT